MPAKENYNYIPVYRSKNKQEMMIKKDILEANGITCTVKTESEKSRGGWGMPLGMEDLARWFILAVDPYKQQDAQEILDSVIDRLKEVPHIILLDADHHILFSRDGFPLESIDSAADPKFFTYYGEYAGENELYQFFTAKKRKEKIKLTRRMFSWQSLSAVLEARRGTGFRTAYCEVMLKGFKPEQEIFSAFAFGNTPRLADKLGDLVRKGKKTGTASLGWVYEAEEEPFPAPGDISIVLNSKSLPLGVIRTSSVDVVPFEKVTAEHAAAEGEGDLSLQYWKKVHWKYFSEECRGIGKTADPQMPVVCEHFSVLALI